MAVTFRPSYAVERGTAEPEDPGPASLTGLTIALLAAAGTAASITVMYLGMATIMETSGAFVASGGPYEIVSPAPDWAWLMPVSVWMMLIFGGLALYGAHKGWGHSPILFGWSALFVSLGWNFLRLGLNPPEFMESTWGWIVPGVLFWIMGFAPPIVMGFWTLRAVKWARDNPEIVKLDRKRVRTAYALAQIAGVSAGVAGGIVLFGTVTG